MERFKSFYIKKNENKENFALIYASNPGPTNALFPIARRLTDNGFGVILRLNEPALSEAPLYFKNQLKDGLPSRYHVSLALSCGHVKINRVLIDINDFKTHSDDLKVVTVDDNFDRSFKLIDALISQKTPPLFAFLMDPRKKEFIQKKLSQSDGGKAVVVNNPSFESFYDRQIDIEAIKKKVRKLMHFSEGHMLLGYFAAPEEDYPPENGKTHHEILIKCLQKILSSQVKGLSFLYKPHGRGKEYCPEEFKTLSPKIQVFYKPKKWWFQNDITIRNQILACDIVVSTNSTITPEMFTAWGLGLSSVPVPVDVTLTKDFSNIDVVKTTLDLDMTTSISSQSEFMKIFPKILKDHLKYQPKKAKERLKKMGWSENPVDKVIRNLAPYMS